MTDMRMDDPIPQYSYIVNQLVAHHPSLAYIHVVEPRVSGHVDVEVLKGEVCIADLFNGSSDIDASTVKRLHPYNMAAPTADQCRRLYT